MGDASRMGNLRKVYVTYFTTVHMLNMDKIFKSLLEKKWYWYYVNEQMILIYVYGELSRWQYEIGKLYIETPGKEL